MMDKRKNNGGARTGTGPKPKDPLDKKKTVGFQIKLRHVDAAKVEIQGIIDKKYSK